MLRFLTCWPLALLALSAGAQTSPPAPASPAWRSALEGYRPFAEQAVEPWRQSNDRVGRIGGWKAYAREAAGMAAPSAPAPAVAPDEPPPAAPPAHGHHHHHGQAR